MLEIKVINIILYIGITFILASVGTQILKKFFRFVTTRKFDLKNFTQDGGFPSSHSSFSMSMGVIAVFFNIWVIKSKCSYEIVVLSIILTFAVINHVFITIRDALGVRRTVQLLSEALERLAKSNKEVLDLISDNNISFDNSVSSTINTNFKEITKISKRRSGHLPHEVIGGIFWGIIISMTTSACFYSYYKLFFFCVVTIVLYIIFFSLFLKYGKRFFKSLKKIINKDIR